MNKPILVLLATMLITTGIVGATTTVDTTWNGGGILGIDFYAGDNAESHFDTGGYTIAGEFHGKDFDDNPYSYNVDTADSFVKASVVGSGSGLPPAFMVFENKRLDSYEGMYGNSGQRSYTQILTDGTAEMSWGSWTNYAEMANCEYGRTPKTASGKNFEATGTYQMLHQLTDASGDGANFVAYGTGSAIVKLQGEKAGGTNSYFNMGSLNVCGDNCAWKNNYATFAGTGAGDFEVNGWADNSITVGCPDCGTGWTIPGDGSDNSAQYNLHVQYAGNFNYQDFGLRGN